jgi:hypothetical protein
MKAIEFKKISKTPKSILKAIPKELRANLDFREDLHTYLCKDDKAKATFLALCFLDPRIFFNACLWTFNSQLKHKHIPFILWPHQDPAVIKIKNALEGETDLFFKKSRKQGATYMILGVYLLYFLVVSDEKFLLGSRKEALVDDGCEISNGQVLGSEETLFFKLLYMINTLPLYLQPRIYKKHLFTQNLDNGAAFRGDTTNIGFGKGFRGRGDLVDEAAQIEPSPTQWIIENLADTCPTSIFNSTNGPWGEAHPYSKLMKEHPDKVIHLSFYDNPTQNYGFYDTPEEGKVTLYDILWYKKHYPEIFKYGKFVA